MRKLIIALLGIVWWTSLSAATYYVSPTGNDNNVGTSTSSAWRTIDKVNSRRYNFVAGDNILFERGGTYRGALSLGSSGASGNPIIVSAYGSGAAPTLSGSTLKTGWIQHAGSIWKVQTAGKVLNVFANGELMTLARYPNTGWLRNDNGTSSQIQDSEITQASGYWTGSTVVVRTSGWSYDTAFVSSHAGSTVNFTPFSYGYNLLNYSWGYFFQNKFSELNYEKEWFYDGTTNTLYFWAPGGVNPNTLTVEAVESNVDGFQTEWGRNYIRVSGLAFRHYNLAAIKTNFGDYIDIENCTFDHCGNAMWIYGDYTNVRNNVISRTLKTALFIVSGPNGGDNNIVENNTLTDCATYPGKGESSWGYFGLRVSGNNNIVRNNRLTRVGYIAIVFDKNTLVEKNFVEYACATLNDGSAIAFDNVDGAIVRKNVVLRTRGNAESCATNFNGCDPKGKGIYFGNVSLKNTLVEDNTVAYCNGAGIWVDHTMVSIGNQIKRNTLFDNNLYQLGISDYSNYNGPGATSPYAVTQYNDVYEGNICYSKTPSQKTMYHINRWYTGVDFGTFTNNYYHNPCNTTSIQIEKFLPSNSFLNYTLAQWQAVRGDDSGSGQSSLSLTYPADTANHILVYNDQLTASSYALPSGTWSEVNGTISTGSVSLEPFTSKVLYRSGGTPPPPIPPTSPSTNVSLLVQAAVSSNSITVSWTNYGSATGYTVFRKLKTETSWGTARATLSSSTTQWTDATVSANTYYEYKVTRASSLGQAHGYVATGITVPSPEYRGQIILVVDNTFTLSLATEISQLITDLKADGWKVSRLDVSRTAQPSAIRSQIQTIWTADPTGVASVLLFGHVPVYRSGNIAPDGHSSIPWASDSYYGELSSTWNNQTSLPSDVELNVGRIDMYNLPAFSQTEEQLLRSYLTKLHEFKVKQYIPQARGLLQDNFTYISNPLAETGYRTFGPLVGAANYTVIPSYNSPNFQSRVTEGYLWTYSSGGGTYNSADGVGSTSGYSTTQHNGIFNMMFGSYFGNWDAISNVPNWNNGANNLLRAPLASGKALTNVWAGQPAWFFHHMGMGDPIGYSTKISMNNRTSTPVYTPQNTGWAGQGYTTIHLSLMGDPTLRMEYVAPPTNLTVTTVGSNTTFAWTASSDQVSGYYLYRLVNGVPIRAHPTLIIGTTVSGQFDVTAGIEYHVRAAKLITNFSGSYWNLSLGTSVITPIPAAIQLQVKAFLNGNFTGTGMTDLLRAQGLIPLSDPYPSLGYTHVGQPTITTNQQVLSTSGDFAPVDWILLEVRSATAPTVRLWTTSGLLCKNGRIITADGSQTITIPLAPGNYLVSIKHRNHLGVMTALPVSLGAATTLIDFTNPTTQTWGTAAQKQEGQFMTLFAGNSNFDSSIRYVGNENDRDLILLKIGGILPTAVTSGYFTEDINLNGEVKYVGLNNDRDPILVTIGGTVPTQVKNEQLP